MKNSTNIGFVVTLLLANLIVLGCHLGVLRFLRLSLWDHMLASAYVMNFLLALFIGQMLYALRRKYTQSLGFIFLGGTVLKFLIFFLVFNPAYKADANLERMEFASFFIPYTVNLIVETAFLVRVLNGMKETH